MTTESLKIITAKPFTTINVIHRQDLATKYLGVFVTPSDIENNNDNDWKVIDEKHSKLIMLDNKCVGAVIQDIATKDVADYYGHKLKLTVDVHPKLNRGRVRHPDDGKLSAHGLHAVFLSPKETSSYVYEEKILILINK